MLLLLAGAFIPPYYLSTWGTLTFAFSLVLIAWGWLPYKRLSQLQKQPEQIIVDMSSLSLEKSGKQIFSIPLKQIKRCGHVDGLETYGICLWLRKPSSVKRRPKWLRSRGSPSCDLFIPYFSHRSYAQLAEVLEHTN